MVTAADTEFVVGENYENEKGVFTVISMSRKEMVIRWESGEEISTDIDLQRNIQARRAWEKLQKENEAKAAKSGSKSGAKARPEFNGFQAPDFKNSASGTKWRGRTQLGGAVTKKLPAQRFNFNSWAFANKPELHWLDVSHRERVGADQGARLLARVDRMSLFYGFGIIRPDDKDGPSNDWKSLVEWISMDESEIQLHQLVRENELSICERTTSESDILVADEDGWRMGDKKYKTAAAFIEELPATGPLYLEITKRIEKIDAVARGKQVADEIASLFTTIMPVYKAALAILG